MRNDMRSISQIEDEITLARNKFARAMMSGDLIGTKIALKALDDLQKELNEYESKSGAV